MAVTLQDGQSLTTAFPRLAMTWPSSDESATLLGKWDCVALQQTDAGIVPQIRAVNPSAVIFTSTNAQELRIEDTDASSTINKVPASWILTQLGSRLTQAVSTDTPTIPVVDTSRFVAGDILVMDEEVAKVVSVNPTARTLTVTRGCITGGHAAAAHPASLRVASAVVFWPGSVVMNLTGYCPAATVTAPSQTWAQYNADLTAEQIESGDWDGVYIDRANPTLSFLAQPGRPYTRSLDPARTNVAATDGYAAYDASYRAALGTYLARIRTDAPGKLIMTNDGATAYSLLNGSSLEYFPRTTWSLPTWQRNVFASGGAVGSYGDWSAFSRQPNMTWATSYDNEWTPTWTASSTFVNPFGTPGWHPNYSKMRFGLCTTLMNNGFFDYEINTSGHGSLGLMWFDEYDGGGRGKGYLGQPISAPRLAAPPLKTKELLGGDGAFSTTKQLRRWATWHRSGYRLSTSRTSKTALVSVSKTRGQMWGATFRHSKVAVKARSQYTVTFRIRATKATQVGVGIQRAKSPYSACVAFGNVNVGTGWQTVTMVGTSKRTDSKAVLSFGVGKRAAKIQIDDVTVRSGVRPNVYRRDFTGGIALVNPDSTAATVPLGAVFKKIFGAQDPAVNSGAYVSSVRIGAHDGVILLRQ